MTFFWAAVSAVLRQLFLSRGCILKSTSIFPPQKADLSLGSLQRDHSFAAISAKNVSSGEDHEDIQKLILWPLVGLVLPLFLLRRGGQQRMRQPLPPLPSLCCLPTAGWMRGGTCSVSLGPSTHCEAMTRRERERKVGTVVETVCGESTVMLHRTPPAKMGGRGSLPNSRPVWGYSKGTPEGF